VSPDRHEGDRFREANIVVESKFVVEFGLPGVRIEVVHGVSTQLRLGIGIDDALATVKQLRAVAYEIERVHEKRSR